MSTNNGCGKVRRNCWQFDFLKLLPPIEQLLKCVFGHLDPEKRDEAIQNATVICMLSYARLHARGRDHVASASSLVWYAALQVKSGRTAGGHLNVWDPMSRYAQVRHGIRLHTCDPTTKTWIEELVEDKRARVHDIVAARLDIRAWLATLRRHTRMIAVDLAKGCSTAETAINHRVSPSRISQIRRELERSWSQFQGEDALC
jgi:hypothetical protein